MMKSRCLVAVSVIVLGLGGMWIGSMSVKADYDMEREFTIQNSMIFEGGGTREVYVSAIVNIEEYDTENMFEKIKEEYIKLNGKSDSLTLRLYESKEGWKSGDCKGERVY